MNTDKPIPAGHATLEQLLRRGDVWRGQSRPLAPQAALDTGHLSLNGALLHQGWPLASLVEVCQPDMCGQGEWLLTAPALRQLVAGYIVVLNPPAMPFAAGLIQLGLDLDRLLIVRADNKADFLAAWAELARAEICAALIAWQPKQNLSYTELRKCLLAAGDGKALCLLFRPAGVRRQSSPAALRLLTQLQAESLRIDIVKQKGWLGKSASQTLHLPLPDTWRPVTDSALHQIDSATPTADLRRSKP
jgi:protein ImuA